MNKSRRRAPRWAAHRRPSPAAAQCGGELTDLPHEAARDLVPPYVWQTQTQFSRCVLCGRVYWRGTHWPALQRRLAQDQP